MNVDDIKNAIRERDGNRCTKCRMTNAEHQAKHGGKSLHVHRKKANGPYTLSNGVTLCYACHGLERVGKPPAGNGYRGRRPVLLGLQPAEYETIKAAAALDGRPVTQFLIYHGLKEAERIRQNPRVSP